MGLFKKKSNKTDDVREQIEASTPVTPALKAQKFSLFVKFTPRHIWQRHCPSCLCRGAILFTGNPSRPAK